MSVAGQEPKRQRLFSIGLWPSGVPEAHCLSAQKHDSFCSNFGARSGREDPELPYGPQHATLESSLSIKQSRGSKMDSSTVPPELEGTKGEIFAARIEVPILAAMIYGIVEFIRLGWSQDYYLYTYAAVLGGIAASVGLFTYFFLVPSTRNRHRKTLLVLLGLLPYLYSLYIIGVLGLFTILEGVIGKFSLLSMIGGIFWVFVGFHLIYRFYLVTEIVRRHDERAMLARSTLPQSDISSNVSS
jgi:hypothetical protein